MGRLGSFGFLGAVGLGAGAGVVYGMKGLGRGPGGNSRGDVLSAVPPITAGITINGMMIRGAAAGAKAAGAAAAAGMTKGGGGGAE